MTQAQLEANRRNAQLSTGPKTPEGKERSSMNAVKSGFYITKLWRITDNAGNLPMCAPCGEEQQNQCRADKKCLLQQDILLKHLKTLRTKNLAHREMLDAIQIAQMDTIFSLKLQEAMNLLGVTELSQDKDGNPIMRSAVTDQHMYMLMNMANHLGKNLEAMQLTRKSQDMADVAWADLAKAELDPVKAAEYREKITKEMAEFRKSISKADEDRALDEAITQHRKQIGENQDKEEHTTDLVIGPNPFGNNGNGQGK